MEQSQIFQILTLKMLEIMPGLEAGQILLNSSMRDLGFNSIDRAEVIVETMADLRLQVPLVKFASAKNIEEVISIFHEHMD